MADTPQTLDLSPLRERLAALSERRDELEQRLGPAAPPVLEMMRFELAHAAWRLAKLEAASP